MQIDQDLSHGPKKLQNVCVDDHHLEIDPFLQGEQGVSNDNDDDDGEKRNTYAVVVGP